MSRYQLEKASGGPSRHPLLCLTEAPGGRFEMAFGWNDGKDAALALEWRPDGSVLLATGTRDSCTPAMSAARARELLQAIIAASERTEDRQSCISDPRSFATLKWSCGGDSEKLSFYGYNCSSSGYTRAGGLRAAGEQILNEATH